MHIISAGAKLENGAVVVASLEKPTAPVADGKQKEDKEKVGHPVMGCPFLFGGQQYESIWIHER